MKFLCFIVLVKWVVEIIILIISMCCCIGFHYYTPLLVHHVDATLKVNIFVNVLTLLVICWFHDGPLSGGHRAIITTNKHFIHAGLSKGPEFLSILVPQMLK